MIDDDFSGLVINTVDPSEAEYLAGLQRDAEERDREIAAAMEDVFADFSDFEIDEDSEDEQVADPSRAACEEGSNYVVESGFSIQDVPQQFRRASTLADASHDAANDENNTYSNVEVTNHDSGSVNNSDEAESINIFKFPSKIHEENHTEINSQEKCTDETASGLRNKNITLKGKNSQPKKTVTGKSTPPEGEQPEYTQSDMKKWMEHYKKVHSAAIDSVKESAECRIKTYVEDIERKDHQIKKLQASEKHLKAQLDHYRRKEDANSKVETEAEMKKEMEIKSKLEKEYQTWKAKAEDKMRSILVQKEKELEQNMLKVKNEFAKNMAKVREESARVREDYVSREMQLMKRNSELQNEVKDLQLLLEREKSLHKEELLKHEQKISELTSNCNKLKKCYESMEATTANLESARLREDYVSREMQHMKRNSELQNEVKDLQLLLEREKSLHKEELLKHEQKISELTSNCNKLKKCYESMEATTANLGTEKNKLLDENAELQKKVNLYQSSANELQMELNKCVKTVAKMYEEIKSYHAIEKETMIKEFNNKMKMKNKELNKYSKELKNLKSQYNVKTKKASSSSQTEEVLYPASTLTLLEDMYIDILKGFLGEAVTRINQEQSFAVEVVKKLFSQITDELNRFFCNTEENPEIHEISGVDLSQSETGYCDLPEMSSPTNMFVRAVNVPQEIRIAHPHWMDMLCHYTPGVFTANS